MCSIKKYENLKKLSISKDHKNISLEHSRKMLWFLKKKTKNTTLKIEDTYI